MGALCCMATITAFITWTQSWREGGSRRFILRSTSSGNSRRAT